MFRSIMLRTIILCIAVIALSGCVTTLHPGSGMKLPTDLVGPFPEDYSVNLINNQPDATPLSFYGGLAADLNEWTQFLIDELSEELQDRGVEISPTSPNELLVKISNLRSVQGFAVVRMYITVLLSTPDNSWSKEIKVNEASAWTIGRALGGVIYRTNEKILTDKEIMNEMRS